MRLAGWAAGLALVGLTATAEARLRLADGGDCSSAVALVIGEEFAPGTALPGIAKDAQDVKRALDAFGIETRLHLNLDVAGARAALAAFAADSPGALHILYVAGAGGTEARAPGRLWFLAAQDGATADDLAGGSLPFDEIAGLIGRGGGPGLIVIDSSLGDVRPIEARQVVMLAGEHGRADESGGYFTQGLVARLTEAAASGTADLLDLFRSAAASAHARSGGVEDAILLLRGSGPTISFEAGRLQCRLPN